MKEKVFDKKIAKKIYVYTSIKRILLYKSM